MATHDSTPRTIEIQLTKGYVAIVDEQDADLAALKWHTTISGKRPYAATNIKVNQRYRLKKLHRFIMERMIKRTLVELEYVDHVDNNPLNNTRSNLRICTFSENVRNKSRYQRNKVGIKGVYMRGNKYRAQIQIDGRKIMLGSFNTEEEAHEAYCKAASFYHGKFARFE